MPKANSQVKLLHNLQIAAHFDANKSLVPLLNQLLYRKNVAETLLRAHASPDSIKQSEEMLEIVNGDIKRTLGLD